MVAGALVVPLAHPVDPFRVKKHGCEVKERREGQSHLMLSTLVVKGNSSSLKIKDGLNIANDERKMVIFSVR